MNKRKLYITAFIMTALLSGCSGNDENSPSDSKTASAETQTITETVTSEKAAVNTETTAFNTSTTVTTAEKNSETSETSTNAVLTSEKESKTSTNTETVQNDTVTNININTDANIDTDTDIETDESTSYEEEPAGYIYSISDVAGTWYLDGDISSDRMTVDYDGNFVNLSRDGTVTRGQAEIESNRENDGTTSHGYAFYKDDGTLWYAFPAMGDIPVCHLYEGMVGIPHYQSETDIVNTNENLWKYCNSMEGTYYLDGDVSAEHYVVDASGGFELISGDGVSLYVGHTAFTSVLNQDGTTSLCGNFETMKGDVLLTFPVKDIENLSSAVEAAGYYRDTINE